MYIKARYANRIELEYDLHRPPNNSHEPNHLIPFCIGLTYEAEAENITTEQIITDILNNVIVP